MNFLINWGIRLLCDNLAHIQTWQWFQLFLNSLLSAIGLLSSVRWLSPLFKVIPGAYQMNRPLPSSKNPNFRNEARCTTLLVKMSFICKRMKNDFHIKGWAPTLVLKQRPGETRKWPIKLLVTFTSVQLRFLGLRFLDTLQKRTIRRTRNRTKNGHETDKKLDKK